MMAKQQQPKGTTCIINFAIGDLKFPICLSLTATMSRVLDFKVKEIRHAYMALTGDTRKIVDTEKATAVVQGAVQEEWYRAHHKKIPPGVIRNQRQRIDAARQSSMSTEEQTQATKQDKPAKEPRKTIRTVIRDAITEGLDNNATLERVKKEFPDSKATMKDVVWNRNKLAAAAKVTTNNQLALTPPPADA